jgi:hypothetical protein
MPLFANINSIKIDNSAVFVRLQTDDYSELALPMFTSARVLLAKFVFTIIYINNHKCFIFSYNYLNNWYCDWLHIPREDGKPRILFLGVYNQDAKDSTLSHFIKHIKKVIVCLTNKEKG